MERGVFRNYYKGHMDKTKGEGENATVIEQQLKKGGKKERAKRRIKHQSRILFPAKLSPKNEGEIKTFSAKQKLRAFVTPRPSLHEMLTGVLQGEMKGR